MRIFLLFFLLFTLFLSENFCFEKDYKEVQKKVVLITGASKGIGLEIAKKLAINGYVVYGSIRATSNKEQIFKAIKECEENLIPVVLDVTSEKSIKLVVEKIIRERGKIDILINNACEVMVGTCETCSIDEQKHIMDVNYFGVVRMLQAVLPYMRKNREGFVINISSVSGFEPFPLSETYGVTKFALEGLTESLAVYLHLWNIKVVLIEPSTVKTNLIFSTEQGSRFYEETLCYKSFCMEGLKELQKNYNSYQNPEEIAALIIEILKSKTLQLRYQTDKISKEMAQSRFKDPSGNESLLKKKARQAKLLEYLK